MQCNSVYMLLETGGFSSIISLSVASSLKRALRGGEKKHFAPA